MNWPQFLEALFSIIYFFPDTIFRSFIYLSFFFNLWADDVCCASRFNVARTFLAANRIPSSQC